MRAIPGADSDHVATSWQALERPESLGRTVVVYDEEGSQQGPSVTQHLAERGAAVHIVTSAAQLGVPTIYYTAELPRVLSDLLNAGVQIHPLTLLSAIDGRSVQLEHTLTGQPRTLDGVDSVVLVTGNRVEDALLKQLQAQGRPAVGIGDCLPPAGSSRPSGTASSPAGTCELNAAAHS